MEERREQEHLLELPDLKPGMLLEVLSSLNQLIFVGRITEVEEDEEENIDSIRIVDDAGNALSYVEYNTVLKLRGFHQAQAVVLEGTVSGSTRKFWRVSQLRALKATERREFFRQSANLPATALCVNEVFGHERPNSPAGDQPMECFIVDISAGGVMIRASEKLEEGDWIFLMNMQLMPGEEPFGLTCQVCRVVQRGTKPAYGCQFIDLEDQDRERLIRGILHLQRKELARQRNGE